MTHLFGGSKEDVLCYWARRGTQRGVSCVKEEESYGVTVSWFSITDLLWCSVLIKMKWWTEDWNLTKHRDVHVDVGHCSLAQLAYVLLKKNQNRKRNVILCLNLFLFSQMKMLVHHSDQAGLVISIPMLWEELGNVWEHLEILLSFLFARFGFWVQLLRHLLKKLYLLRLGKNQAVMLGSTTPS